MCHSTRSHPRTVPFESTGSSKWTCLWPKQQHSPGLVITFTLLTLCVCVGGMLSNYGFRTTDSRLSNTQVTREICILQFLVQDGEFIPSCSILYTCRRKHCVGRTNFLAISWIYNDHPLHHNASPKVRHPELIRLKTTAQTSTPEPPRHPDTNKGSGGQHTHLLGKPAPFQTT